MIWNPKTLLRALFAGDSLDPVRPVAQRWRRAAQADPLLIDDLIVFGEVLGTTPISLQDGLPQPMVKSATELAYEKGRRDMTLQLMALMMVTPEQLRTRSKETAYDVE
jgi:hypothetical protein